MNVLHNKGMNQYKHKMFSRTGYKTLETYTTVLVKWYVDEGTKYPFNQGIILGIPQMAFAREIPSKEALFERIKAYATILGKKEFTFKKGDSEVTFSLEVKQ